MDKSLTSEEGQAKGTPTVDVAGNPDAERGPGPAVGHAPRSATTGVQRGVSLGLTPSLALRVGMGRKAVPAELTMVKPFLAPCPAMEQNCLESGPPQASTVSAGQPGDTVPCEGGSHRAIPVQDVTP
jgi:hypothetical protein